jgi:hypothetical protein
MELRTKNRQIEVMAVSAKLNGKIGAGGEAVSTSNTTPEGDRDVGSDSSPPERKSSMFSRVRRGLVLSGCLLSVVEVAVVAGPGAASSSWFSQPSVNGRIVQSS